MSDFEVMDKMSKDNMDIVMFPDLIGADKIKGGFKISFGVPEAAGHSIANDIGRAMISGKDPDYFTIVYRVNRKQFEAIKNNSKV